MSHPDRGPDDPYLPERFLLDQLRQLENPGEHGNYSSSGLTLLGRGLIRPVLRRDAVDTQAGEAEWFDGILMTPRLTSR